MTTGFVILLIVVGVLALAAWPICVVLARRRNYQMRREAQPRADRLRADQLRADQLRADQLREDQPGGEPEQPHGTVMGGSHVGGGRSVAPRRDEAVVPEQGVPVQSSTPESHR
jgi:hypothetical protein